MTSNGSIQKILEERLGLVLCSRRLLALIFGKYGKTRFSDNLRIRRKKEEGSLLLGMEGIRGWKKLFKVEI